MCLYFFKSSKYLYLAFSNVMYLIFDMTFFIYLVSINISVSWSHVMSAKLITLPSLLNKFHQTSCFQPSKYPLIATVMCLSSNSANY